MYIQSVEFKVSLMKCHIQKHSVALSWGETPPILPIAVIQQSVPSDRTGMEGSILLLSCAVLSFFITHEDKQAGAKCNKKQKPLDT